MSSSMSALLGVVWEGVTVWKGVVFSVGVVVWVGFVVCVGVFWDAAVKVCDVACLVLLWCGTFGMLNLLQYVNTTRSNG